MNPELSRGHLLQAVATVPCILGKDCRGSLHILLESAAQEEQKSGLIDVPSR